MYLTGDGEYGIAGAGEAEAVSPSSQQASDMFQSC